MIQTEAAGLTDIGAQRENNEDAFFLDDSGRLFVVADGMGGHLAGEVASSIVTDTMCACLHSAGEPGEQTSDGVLSPEAGRLTAWVKKANAAVHERALSDESCHGMGSTLAALYCTDSTAIAANVGDSPIYLVRKGEIEKLSVTHTVAAEQAAIDPERLKNLSAKFMHMLSRAMGVGDSVQPDICETPCFPGDIFILCSDGLSNKVSPEEMIEIVQSQPSRQACQTFIDKANERGGDDNITVIVIKIVDVHNPLGLWRRLRSKLFGF